MKNYKGFNKMPYCNAHYPSLRATQVADTPEQRRLAENTRNQSLIVYHKDFEENKKKFTVVSDDPEMRRNMENTNKFSQIKYGADREQLKGRMIAVSDGPELRRIRQNTANISQAEYRGVKGQREIQESARNLVPQTVRQGSLGSDDEEPPERPSIPGIGGFSYAAPEARNIGRISEYTPDRYGAQEWQETVPAPSAVHQQPQHGNYHGSYQSNPTRLPGMEKNHSEPRATMNVGGSLELNLQQPLPPTQPQINPEFLDKPADFLDTMDVEISSYRFQALYDYDAQDDDEVSFKEDDYIVDCQKVDQDIPRLVDWNCGEEWSEGHAAIELRETGLLTKIYVRRKHDDPYGNQDENAD
ncbi:DgyrCDS11025 [Dimorphilus gyrociliatus]|uniref:DgyrCDS11025 n=1 Tax=Dimorphilus gyrociliatus TaxID=2664684 RepID=A0A7I8W368_9ANNE|nr:DgyrCDS11025 [Dimorphilus gyrociliatus]